MRSLIAALVAAVACASIEDELDFLKYAVKFNKNYEDEKEFAYRLANFIRINKLVKEHDAEAKGFEIGHNKFSDWSRAELAMLRGDLEMNEEATEKNNSYLEAIASPASYDWRDEGVVPPVRDQGHCGSCWAFSAAGVLEMGNAIANGTKGSSIKELSEQQLVDCVSKCHGCNGGFSKYAFDYAIKNPLEARADYEYTAQTGTCSYKKSKAEADGSATCDYLSSSPSEAEIKAAISHIGPVSVSIDASSYEFHHYTSGVLECEGEPHLDHAVIAVGYRTEKDGSTTWIVRNSWGSDWGDKGYVYMKGNSCGLEVRPTTAVVPQAQCDKLNL